MRIACVHIPQFALQCATRLDPTLRGTPVAVVSGVGPGGGASGVRAGGVLHAPIVLACSRAAWAVGVRLGMTATAARGLSSQLQVVTAESMIERETVRAIADSMLALTSLVDVGGRVGAGGAHLAMYAEVPAKTRGATFGDRVLGLLDELGFTARIGIADDRFTAWVAAAHGGAEDRGVVSVPRGGSAAFLAPRPLSLLAIPVEVQHMLEALGVRTLGEFASLPAPSVARPVEADYQALARGESGSHLRPYTPEAPVREEIVVHAGVAPEVDPAQAGVLSLGGSVGATAVISLVARHIALRLAGRGRLVARLEVAAVQGATETEIAVPIDHAVGSAEDIARVLGPVLERTAGAGDAWRLRVLVAGEALAEGEVSETVAESSSPFAVASDAAMRDFDEARRSADIDATISPLAVVLSSTGSLFSLTAPSAPNDRRNEAHRRTRRGKQRRARSTASTQPRLFDRTSVK
jgi:nucleotidyltransferase/DNA polymerase involved in DNA repair